MSTPAFHTHAAILSTGDELVMGQLQDTNARWLAERLTEAGVRVAECVIVGDDLTDLSAAINRLASAAPLVVISGGLGPTDGDLTRQAVCDATGDTLCLDAQSQHDLVAFLASRGRIATERQLRQAFRPSRAACLPNPIGTAPGLHALVGDATDLICLPGPPGELRPMWHHSAAPLLRPDPSRAVLTRLFTVVGTPEADLADLLKSHTARGGAMTVNLTASGGVITVRARAEGLQTPDLLERFSSVTRTIRDAIGPRCVSERPSGDTPGTHLLCESVLSTLSLERSTLAVVESCTGGMMGQWLSAVPGSSRAFIGGLITYTNQFKVSAAGVEPDLLATHGAVSGETARAMAVGGLAATGATHALAITGIAGPAGGSADKPVGTVWCALAARSGSQTEHEVRLFRFPGDRLDVRTRACTAALTMLHFKLARIEPGRLLWEQV